MNGPGLITASDIHITHIILGQLLRVKILVRIHGRVYDRVHGSRVDNAQEKCVNWLIHYAKKHLLPHLATHTTCIVMSHYLRAYHMT